MQLRALAHRSASFTLAQQRRKVDDGLCTRGVKPRDKVDEPEELLDDSDEDDVLPDILEDAGLAGDLSDLTDLDDDDRDAPASSGLDAAIAARLAGELSDLSDASDDNGPCSLPVAPLATPCLSAADEPVDDATQGEPRPGTEPPCDPSGPAQSSPPPVKKPARRRKGKGTKPRHEWTPEQRANAREKAKLSGRTAARREARVERRIAKRVSAPPPHAKSILAEAEHNHSSFKASDLAKNTSPFISGRGAPESAYGSTFPVYRGGFCRLGLRATSRPYINFALRQAAGPAWNCVRHVRDLVSERGYAYVPNIREAQVFTDAAGVVYAVKPPQPVGDGWAAKMDYLYDRLVRLRSELKLSEEENVRHARGDFQRMSCGVAHGGGRKGPTVIAPDWKRNKAVVQEFFKDPIVQAVCRHVQNCLFTWFPDVAKLYRELEEELKRGGLDLKDVFGPAGQDINLPFAAQTLNLGPQVRCLLHRDSQNFQPGVCTSLTLGQFDHTRSGHFIMVEPKVVLELKHGDVLLFLSSLITHGNAPLRSKETRMSWTCWTAGGLFRWAAAGHALLGSLNTASKQRRYFKKAHEYARRGWEALLTLSKLEARFKPTAPAKKDETAKE